MIVRFACVNSQNHIQSSVAIHSARQKECPACRAPCSKDDIFRNYSLEVLLQKLTEERDSEQQRYFNDLANNAIHQLDMKREGSQNNDYIQREKQDQSPIETVFMMNLRESLLSYQEYFEGLLKEKEVLIKKVKHSHSQNLLNARLADNQMEQSSINLQIDLQLKEIEQKFSNAIDSLVQSYDEHMRNIIPKPKLLPIRISIQIDSKKGLRIENIHVKPYENLNDLLKQIEDFQLNRGDKIQNWNKNNLVIQLNGPMRVDNEKIQFDQLDQILSQDLEMQIDGFDIQNQYGISDSLSQQIIIKDWTVPFSKFNIAAGSLIIIKGGPVEFESDKPLECMTLYYDKDPNSTFNYFSCKTCNSNWICENCKDGCHQGHNLLPHLLNHRPTWACCYCMKKDLCKIANKKNKSYYQ
eukprot:403339430